MYMNILLIVYLGMGRWKINAVKISQGTVDNIIEQDL